MSIRMDNGNDRAPQYKSLTQHSQSDVAGRNDVLFETNELLDSIHINHKDSSVEKELFDGNLSFREEVSFSFYAMKSSKLNLLLVFAPVAFFGSKTGILGEFQCFCCAGLALIPCAERLSFVTEYVAEHTNETIGALLNATFGNAPELLISNAALRSGFYRVVQLTLLGSVLTNLLFVFGISCFIGGLRWQKQTLRITSGNVSIGMLLAACMGLVLPAALKLAKESKSSTKDDTINASDVSFSRFNSVIMVTGYICYLIFQLGSHKEEFDFNHDDNSQVGCDSDPQLSNYTQRRPLPQNRFCRRYCFFTRWQNNDELPIRYDSIHDDEPDVEMANLHTKKGSDRKCSRRSIHVPQSQEEGRDFVIENRLEVSSGHTGEDEIDNMIHKTKSKSSDVNSLSFDDIQDFDLPPIHMTLRCGLVWLAVVTLIISLMSGIVVDTIDGFAARSKMSEVFTSVIIIPFFSNIAEMVSAIIFAYKNKMDLCIGVTVGSAIQIAQLVMPLTCLWSWVMGRSMTLYFRAYETICFLLGVLCVAAVLQIGTTNWLVGCYLLSVYFMIAAGFFFHEVENISTDGELL